MTLDGILPGYWKKEMSHTKEILRCFDLNGKTLVSYTQKFFFYTTQQGSRQSGLIDFLLGFGILFL